MAHTKEPWAVDDMGFCIGKAGTEFWLGYPPSPDAVAGLFDGEYIENPNHKEDSRRIVACVNALAGYNPDAVADVVAALEFAVSALCSVRKSYEESNGLWDDASRAIADGNSALTRLRSIDNA